MRSIPPAMSGLADKPEGRILLYSVGLTLAAMGVLVVIALAVEPETAQRIFSEEGLPERASEWLWLLLAVALPVVIRPLTIGVIAGSIVCLFAAAREADWHLRFTGYSVLKPGFYVDEGHPLGQQLIAGALVLLLAASLIVLLYRVTRPLRPRHWPWPVWTLGMLFIVVVVVGSKLLDRAPAILRDDFGMVISPRVLSVGLALEEGIEALTPLIVLGVVLSFVAASRAIGPAADRSAMR